MINIDQKSAKHYTYEAIGIIAPVIAGVISSTFVSKDNSSTSVISKLICGAAGYVIGISAFEIYCNHTNLESPQTVKVPVTLIGEHGITTFNHTIDSLGQEYHGE
ncbi:MAG: hypothetical protein DGJ47_000246 [Rickettsiaceae bacterium]